MSSTSVTIEEQRIGRYCPCSLQIGVPKRYAVLRYAPKKPLTVIPDTYPSNEDSKNDRS